MMEKNQRFLNEISENITDKSTKIILLYPDQVHDRDLLREFLTTRQGFSHCYNCLEGFEGNHNEIGQRSTVNGWKFSGLPWKQG